MKPLRYLATLFYMAVTPAIAGVWQHTEGFESRDPARTGWFAGPGSGFDFEKNLAHSGKGNAWVRNLSGWSAVNAWITPPRDASRCTVQAWIRMSDGITGGYFSVRRGNGITPGPVINERKLVGPNPASPSNANYNLVSFDFTPTGGPLLFYVGNWGNGRDNWIQIDDFGVSCATPYPA